MPKATWSFLTPFRRAACASVPSRRNRKADLPECAMACRGQQASVSERPKDRALADARLLARYFERERRTGREEVSFFVFSFRLFFR